MDNIEQQNTGDLFPDSLQIDEKARQHFAGITSWCIVIVVVAVIGYILNVADLLMRKSSSVQSEGFSFNLGNTRSPAGTVIGLIIGVLLNYFLFSFARQTQKALSGFDQDRLNSGFSNLKIYFIFFSVIMIILCLFLLLAVPTLM